MKDKTLRVGKKQNNSLLRKVSVLIREFFTPREIRMMMDDYTEEVGYDDFPVDLTSPKLISSKTLGG